MLNTAASYPSTRLRRNRKAPWSRRLVQEHRLSVEDLVWPVFVREGKGQREPVPSMPGVVRYSVDTLVEAVKEACGLGIPAIALFPVVEPSLKTEDAREALNVSNLVCRAVEAVKQAVPEIGIICDVALDPYTSHGHDGLVRDGDVANDETLEVLCTQALTLAAAGADVVAPSDMMDGRVGVVRRALDVHGYTQVQILSYAVKYASAFYGPFRDALGSAGNLGKSGKHSYQMHPANSREALREAALDVAEGADMLMVKPGLPYLDIIQSLRQHFPVPVMAYQVSGEYAMLQAAAQNGWLNGEAAMMESLLSFKRAGADAVFTYAAIEMAKVMRS